MEYDYFELEEESLIRGTLLCQCEIEFLHFGVELRMMFLVSNKDDTYEFHTEILHFRDEI